MKTSVISAAILSLVVAHLGFGQTPTPIDTTASTDSFEELPQLKASEILADTYLVGPHHKVREEVPTYSGANRFTIDSEFGLFEAEGNEMLIRRVTEINAIAKLREVSRTDEFKKA